jgi:hypothetical protein
MFFVFSTFFFVSQKLDGKRRGSQGVREPRWILRDQVRKRAERKLRKEAEAKGKPPPHDPRMVNINKGGLLMMGSREGILKAANEDLNQKKVIRAGPLF